MKPERPKVETTVEVKILLVGVNPNDLADTVDSVRSLVAGMSEYCQGGRALFALDVRQSELPDPSDDPLVKLERIVEKSRPGNEPWEG